MLIACQLRFSTSTIVLFGISVTIAHLTSALSPSGAEREKRRSTLRHASTSLQFVFGEGLDGQGQELREEWVVGFVGFAQF